MNRQKFCDLGLNVQSRFQNASYRIVEAAKTVEAIVLEGLHSLVGYFTCQNMMDNFGLSNAMPVEKIWMLYHEPWSATFYSAVAAMSLNLKLSG